MTLTKLNEELMWLTPIKKGIEYSLTRGKEKGITHKDGKWFDAEGNEYQLLTTAQRNAKVQDKMKNLKADVVYGGKQRDGRGLGT